MDDATPTGSSQSSSQLPKRRRGTQNSGASRPWRLPQTVQAGDLDSVEVVSTPDKHWQGAADQVTPPKRLRLRSKQSAPLVECSLAATHVNASTGVVVLLPATDVAAGAGVPLSAAAEPGEDGSRAPGRMLYLRFHSAFVRWQARKKRGEPEAEREGTAMHDLRCSGLRSLSGEGRFLAVQQWAAEDELADDTLKQ